MLEAVTVAVDESSVWLLVSSGKYRLYYRDGVTSEDPQVGVFWILLLQSYCLILLDTDHNHKIQEFAPRLVVNKFDHDY